MVKNKGRRKMSVWTHVAIALLIVGGFNWFLGIWNVNLVTLLSWKWLIYTVYTLIGASAAYALVWWLGRLVK